jgi:hypothetical protein
LQSPHCQILNSAFSSCQCDMAILLFGHFVKLPSLLHPMGCPKLRLPTNFKISGLSKAWMFFQSSQTSASKIQTAMFPPPKAL